MIGEFRIAKGWRIFIYIVSLPLIALFVFVGILPFKSEPFNLTILLLLLPISVGAITLFAFGLVQTIIERFTIGDDYFSLKGLFGTRILSFSEIKGFRSDDKYIRIVPLESSKKPMKISSYVERHGDIIIWLSDNFPDIDQLEIAQEEERILQNEELGITNESREHKLIEARTVSKYINVIGTAIFIWLVFIPKPYIICLSVGIIFPIAIIPVLYFYGGLIKMDEKKNSAYPSIIYGFVLTSVGLMIRSLFDYDIMYSKLWVFTGSIALILLVFILIGSQEFHLKKIIDYLTILSLGLLVYGYSYGAYVVSNCLFDETKPQNFKTHVVEKEISTGQVNSYYLKLKPCGPSEQINKVSVGKSIYNETTIGDSVNLYLKNGLFKTSWFYVEK
jgi:hypothetical protein